MPSSNASPKPKRSRRVFVRGRMVARPVPRPCDHGRHVGPLVDTERFRNFPDPFWKDFGLCACCGSTVRADDVAKVAA